MRNIPDYDLSWRKSTYSGGGDNCLEVSDNHPAALIPVRDSKTAPHGPKLTFRPEAWSAFVRGIKN